jgi:hypothetical protein
MFLLVIFYLESGVIIATTTPCKRTRRPAAIVQRNNFVILILVSTSYFQIGGKWTAQSAPSEIFTRSRGFTRVLHQVAMLCTPVAHGRSTGPEAG